MARTFRGLTWMAVWFLLSVTASCSSVPPADQFKSVSDAKKSQLTHFLEGKQSRLSAYEATVTEERNLDKGHTHVGRIELKYTVTRPNGKQKEQKLDTAIAEYHFSRKDKKWVFQECSVNQGVGFVEPEDGFLVTPPEMKAVFEK